MSKVLDLIKVRVRRRCPDCGQVSVKRNASQQGATLWDLSEACTIPTCAWARLYSNVKIGV